MLSLVPSTYLPTLVQACAAVSYSQSSSSPLPLAPIRALRSSLSAGGGGHEARVGERLDRGVPHQGAGGGGETLGGPVSAVRLAGEAVLRLSIVERAVVVIECEV